LRNITTYDVISITNLKANSSIYMKTFGETFTKYIY